MSEAGAVAGGIITIFIAIVLVWALYPAMVQIGGIGWGLFFAILSILMIIGAAIGLAKG